MEDQDYPPPYLPPGTVITARDHLHGLIFYKMRPKPSDDEQTLIEDYADSIFSTFQRPMFEVMQDHKSDPKYCYICTGGIKQSLSEDPTLSERPHP